MDEELGEAKEIGAQKDDHNLTTSMNAKYKVFHDEEDVILDVTEEQHKIDLELLTAQEQPHDPYAGINLEREYMCRWPSINGIQKRKFSYKYYKHLVNLIDIYSHILNNTIMNVYKTLVKIKLFFRRYYWRL